MTRTSNGSKSEGWKKDESGASSHAWQILGPHGRWRVHLTHPDADPPFSRCHISHMAGSGPSNSYGFEGPRAVWSIWVGVQKPHRSMCVLSRGPNMRPELFRPSPSPTRLRGTSAAGASRAAGLDELAGCNLRSAETAESRDMMRWQFDKYILLISPNIETAT